MTKLFMSLEIWSATKYFPKIILKEELINRFVHFEGQIPWNPSWSNCGESRWMNWTSMIITIIENSKDLSDGIHSLLGQFTDLTFSREENKNKVIRCGFFNLSNGIFWVFYEKFDSIILKIWSLLLFSQSVRELMGDWKERSVNRPRREWIPSENTLVHTI